VNDPLVSCLMISRGGRWPAAQAIASYRAQSHVARELVIVSTRADDPVARLAAETGDRSIRHVAVPPASLGELRNAAVAHARGTLIAHWDDDDLHHRDRLARQVEAMRSAGTKACFLRRILIWWPARRGLAITHARPWEGTMLADREIVPVFPALPREEDLFVLERMQALHRLAELDWPEGYCYVVHGANTNQPAHFEGIFGIAQPIPDAADYAAAIERLSRHHDFNGYLAMNAPA
jgi:glycosyltransferase involved in cell wall biosynthesis